MQKVCFFKLCDPLISLCVPLCNGFKKRWLHRGTQRRHRGTQRHDKLNIAIVANGRDLLVDGGRFAYRGAIADKFRKYATGSKSHNLIVIDGKGQAAGPKLANEPLAVNRNKITPDFDYAWGSFDQFSGLEGKCTHTRSLLYIRGNLWVVVDRVTTVLG